jgi:hypothetical protein
LTTLGRSDAALGLHGLRSPGYYILALHFRRIPLGFEPLSVMLNEKQHKEWRMNHLAGFWETGERFARKAAEIARCRNQVCGRQRSNMRAIIASDLTASIFHYNFIYR